MSKKILIRALLCIIWAGFIFYNSSRTGEESKEQSYKVVNSIKKEKKINIDNKEKNKQTNINKEKRKLNNYLRKIAHLIEYFILMILVLYFISVFNIQQSKMYFLAFIIVILYAISDELHQLFVPGRGASVRDVMIDSLGAILAGSVYFICAYFKIIKYMLKSINIRNFK